MLGGRERGVAGSAWGASLGCPAERPSSQGVTGRTWECSGRRERSQEAAARALQGSVGAGAGSGDDPRGPPWPVARRRWRCAGCSRSPARPGLSLPRLRRGNDLRGNLGRAGRERGRGGGARDAAAMPRWPEDPAGAAGRSVGLRPARPAPHRGTGGGIFPPRFAAASILGALRLMLPSEPGLGGAAAGVPGGLGWRKAPARGPLGAGGSVCGWAGMGWCSQAAGGAPRVGAQGRQSSLAAPLAIPPVAGCDPAR